MSIADGDEQSCEHLLQKARSASNLLKAMANERRLLVLCYLGANEMSVSELERLVGLSQSALSQHLARLRNDGLVSTRRNGQTIYYSLKGMEARRILDTLHALFCQESETIVAMAAANSAGVKPLPDALVS